MAKAGQVVAGRQFSLASLLVVMVALAILMGLARIIAPAVQGLAGTDLTLLWWMGGMVGLAFVVGLFIVYANR